ncbi:MAG: hypothetical protein RI957_699 [Verrucomicrobiota bacterium]|jgi:uncharacterized protein YijF (DUF1287 family)
MDEAETATGTPVAQKQIGRMKRLPHFPRDKVQRLRTYLFRMRGCLIFLMVLAGILPSIAQNAGETFALKLVHAARSQVGVTIRYEPAYAKLDYPMGDVPKDRGVCTDVVIRALRACGPDLQELVHLDMKKNFSAYPRHWGLNTTDRNIDHRRVPNLMSYFTRRGMQLAKNDDPKRFQPGDLVTCLVGRTLPHIMIISDKRGPSGHPMVLHNIGAGAQEEDCLHDFPHTGHYRWK